VTPASQIRPVALLKLLQAEVIVAAAVVMAAVVVKVAAGLEAVVVANASRNTASPLICPSINSHI